MNTMTSNEYYKLKSKVIESPDKCPKCGNNKITKSDPELLDESREVFIDFTCDTCGFDYRNYYHLHDMEVKIDNKCVAQEDIH